MDLGLRGKRVLVTGAAKGIGRATVLAFAREGADVAVNYVRSGQQAVKTVEECRTLGVEAIDVQADVGVEDQVEAMLHHLQTAFGPVDILVNNAGVYTALPLTRLDSNTWRGLLDVNLNGAFFCARHLLPPMMERNWGRIVNVTGFSALTGGAVLGTAAYGAASKAGLVGLTKTLAREAAAANVTVNAVSPAIAATDIMAPLLADPARHAAVLERIPIRRASQPAEVANVIVFLASDLASSITGQVVDVSGGAAMS